MSVSRQFVIAVFVLCLVTLVFADVPRIISYQGLLTDPASGDPIPDGPYSVYFNIYDDPFGVDPLWTEHYPTLLVAGGLYSVRLGEATPFPDTLDFSVPYWLEVIVDGTPMLPRYRLTSSPYALNIPDTIRKDATGGNGVLTLIDTDLTNLGHGLVVDGHGEYGIWVKHGYHGVVVEDVGGGGLEVYNPGYDGLLVDTPTMCGVYIAYPGEHGVYISNNNYGPGYYGIKSSSFTTGDTVGFFGGNVHITGDLTVDGSFPGGGGGLWVDNGTSISPVGNPDIIVHDAGENDGIQVVNATHYAGRFSSSLSAAILGSTDGYGVFASGTMYGVRGYHSGTGNYGDIGTELYAGNFHGDVVVSGSFKSDEVIKITLNGIDFVGNSDPISTSDVETQYTNYASVQAYEGTSDGQGIIMASIPFPTYLYGNNVEIDSIRIYYKTLSSLDYINITQLRENTLDGSYTALTDDGTNRTSTSITSYKLTCNDVVSVGTGGVYLFLNIYYSSDGGTVIIYGAEVYMHQP